MKTRYFEKIKKKLDMTREDAIFEKEKTKKNRKTQCIHIVIA